MKKEALLKTIKKTFIVGYEREFPVVVTFNTEGIRQMFYCDKCKKLHFHGEGDGHRSAHCFVDDGYKKGYILLNWKDLTDDQKAKVKDEVFNWFLNSVEGK